MPAAGGPRRVGMQKARGGTALSTAPSRVACTCRARAQGLDSEQRAERERLCSDTLG